MPLFVTVAPGAVVSDNTPIDAALLNLLAQPSVSVVGSVDGGSLALGAGSVIANSLASNAVTTAAIADGAVTAAKLGALAVTTAKIDALAVTTAKIDINAVTTAKILDANVTLAKIAPITTGNIVGTGTGGTGNSLTISSGLTYDSTKLYWSPSIAQTHATTIVGYTMALARPTNPGVNLEPANNIAVLNTSILTTRLNSRILITVNINYEAQNSGNDGVFLLYRKEAINGTTVEIGMPAQPASQPLRPYGIAVGTYDSNSSTTANNVSFTYLDTVSAVTTYTYKLCWYNGVLNDFFINSSTTATNSAAYEVGTSRMILQEFPV